MIRSHEELKSRLRGAIEGKKEIRMTPRIISLAKHASQHNGMVREEMEEKTKESSVMLAAGFEFVNRWTFVGD